MKLGLFEEAQTEFNKSLKFYTVTNDAHGLYKVYYNMGLNYRNLNMLQESINAFGNAITRFDTSQALNNRGLSQFESENYSAAVKDFSDAIKKSEPKISDPHRVCEPKKAVHFNNRGLALYHSNQNEKALEDFAKAHQIAPKDPNVLYNRGNVFLTMNLFDEARKDFDAAIKIQPTRPKFYHAKGLAYEAQATYVEQELLTNPAEPELDTNGYPIRIEESKTPASLMSPVSQTETQTMMTNANN